MKIKFTNFDITLMLRHPLASERIEFLALRDYLRTKSTYSYGSKGLLFQLALVECDRILKEGRHS